MKVKVTKGRMASPDAIAALQRNVGERLPAEFIDFVARNDGAEAEPNIFKIEGTNESGVNRFIPVAQIVDEIALIENLPAKSFPVAWAEGGNYVVINLEFEGGVFFWDHERPERVIRLAKRFRSFLELLEPFDVSAVELKPGQVTKAWIDPEFLRGLKR